jgi:hypothetical protein
MLAQKWPQSFNDKGGFQKQQGKMQSKYKEQP